MSATTAETGRSGRRRSRGAVESSTSARAWGKTALLAVIFLWCLFPFFWLIMTSFKVQGALNSPNLFDGPFGLANYRNVFNQDFHLNLRNSLAIATMTTEWTSCSRRSTAGGRSSSRYASQCSMAASRRGNAAW